MNTNYVGMIVADLHIGAINPSIQYNEFKSIFLDRIEDIKPDYIIFLGDYFDHKASLNDELSYYSFYIFDELISRIKAVLRRTRQMNSQDKEEFNIGCLSVNIKKHTVFVDGSEVTLSFKEFSILSILLSANGNVVSREELFAKVWQDYYGESRTLDVHIRNLRAKLGEAGQYIQTVKNVGYKIGGDNIG